MNTRIKTVLENKEAQAMDYFGLVNFFTYSTITVCKDGETVMAMDINKAEGMGKNYEFSQNNTGTKYLFGNDDIVSVAANFHEEEDFLIIEAICKDDRKLYITIFHTSTNTTLVERERYYEMDFYSLKNYLEDKKHHVSQVHIKDEFGVDVCMQDICSAFIDSSDSENVLTISSKGHMEFSVPLVDDSCNEMYIKKNNFTDWILIKPYGQPFMEITIMVRKDAE